MLDPYFDQDGAPTDNRGMDFIDPEVLVQAVPRLDALGFQAHFHALGDRAVRLGLDAVEAARRQNGWSDTRPHLAHLQLVHPDDIPRFRRLGAVANVQPIWAVHEGQMDKLTLPFLGPVAGARQYPLRSFRRHGVTHRHGLGLVRVDRRPVRADGHRGQPRDRGHPRPRASSGRGRRSCPRSRSSSPRR